MQLEKKTRQTGVQHLTCSLGVVSLQKGSNAFVTHDHFLRPEGDLVQFHVILRTAARRIHQNVLYQFSSIL